MTEIAETESKAETCVLKVGDEVQIHDLRSVTQSLKGQVVRIEVVSKPEPGYVAILLDTGWKITVR